ncbi:hypothetical protein MKX03_008604 [Papaver bracteatum]|nr:hypothetical protein MKX03_008604 [Papaver bracteatum]
MSIDDDNVEEGGITEKSNHNPTQEDHEDSSSSKVMKWGLLILSCIFNLVGFTVGPILNRLYFLHGGNKIWFYSWLQTAGFPILIIPLAVIYARRGRNLLRINFFASRKLLFYAALIGLIYGVLNFTFCYGLLYLPVSTWSLICTTQLVFTSFISFIWVKHKFTPYTVNAIVVIIIGCVLLGIRRAGDRLPGVTNSQYLVSFFITLASAAILGFILVSTQVAYAKANQAMTYPIVLQFLLCMCFFGTVSSSIGCLISKDFLAIRREASEFGLGAKSYYLVLVLNMVFWQLMLIGRVGIIFCTSSLFAGVMSTVFLPISQIAAVLTFHESFPAEKGMALVLTLWGFTSYFYGSYKTTRRQKSATMQ